MAIYESGKNMASNLQFSTILTQEGVDQYSFPFGIQKSQGLIDSSVRLFGFIPEDDDPRWHLAHQYQRVILEGNATTFHFEVGMIALYLGEEPSRRTGYPSTVSPENVRQMSRAFQNLGARKSVEQRFESTDAGDPEGYELELALTDSIAKGINKQGITACPEALHQIRLYKNGIYLARVGFNVHTEGSGEQKKDVISITNLQGTPDNRDTIAVFSEQFGLAPFNLLVRRVKSMAQIDGLPVMELRGLRNPKTAESAPLYNTVFRKESIPRFHFLRKKPTEPTGYQAALAVLFQPRKVAAEL